MINQIQIQHLLKLNMKVLKVQIMVEVYSNTTLVKVKYMAQQICVNFGQNSNTTLVKVKC